MTYLITAYEKEHPEIVYSAVVLHRQQALKEADKLDRKHLRVIVRQVNGVGDEREIFDSRGDEVRYSPSDHKYHILGPWSYVGRWKNEEEDEDQTKQNKKTSCAK